MGIDMGKILKEIGKEYEVREQNFEIGHTVKVFTKIVEGKRERIQIFEGTVIGIQGSGVEKSFKVRKMVGGLGVERTFPLQSRMIQKIEPGKKGKVRRAKLFYLRDRIGKKALLKPEKN